MNTPTIWAAPCQQCGADVLTDQHLGSPYFGSPCECGGYADASRWRVSDEPHPATYETPRR
jgi:hypothetical protein